MSSLQPKLIAPSTAASAAIQPAPSSSDSLKNLKGSMTLPLQSSVNVGNNLAHIRGLTPLAQLNSPDLKGLGLNASSGVTPFLTSPDFDKLISQSLGVGMTPTSSGSAQPQTPTAFLNPKYVTEEQERFVMNFDEKIKSMIKKEQEAGGDENHIATSGTVITDISFATSAPGQVAMAISAHEQQPQHQQHQHQQPQQQQQQHEQQRQQVIFPAQIPATRVAASTAPVTLSLANQDELRDSEKHVDLSEQELLKLERKRQRNRDAARKCRERKLERILFLEERVAELKSQNGKLQRTAASLRDHVKTLRHVVLEHTKRGCCFKDAVGTTLGVS